MFWLNMVSTFFQIAFRVAYVVDGGNTVVNRAGRISLEYEGKQLFGYLDSFIGGWAKSKGAQTKAFTASATNTNVSKASFREQNQLILSKVNNTRKIFKNNIVKYKK